MLKNLKLHESTISMVLGFLVIVVVGLVVVNYFRNLDTGETFPTGANTEQQAEEQNSYTVAAGDTLWSISEKFYGTGFNWVDIRDANNLSSGNIEVGQILSIPGADSRPEGEEGEVAMATAEPEEVPATPVVTLEPTTETASPVPTIAQPEPTIEEQVSPIIGDNYTVVRGDNLWEIAERAYGDGFRWVDIAEANDLVHPSLIHAGNVLVLPR